MVNVSMYETLINFIAAKKGGKVGRRGRGKKIPLGTVVNEEVPQEEQQLGRSQQCSNLAESSNDESSDGEGDDTTCKMCKIGFNAICTMNVSSFVLDHKHYLFIDFHSIVHFGV